MIVGGKPDMVCLDLGWTKGSECCPDDKILAPRQRRNEYEMLDGGL
jgi:hypothetical protein